MKISLMIEGQNGLNWKSWKSIVEIAEKHGFYGLYRSDHFTNANPPDLDSLELWVSLSYVAAMTERIKFGSLVSPVSFRHPVFTARMAAAVDDLSKGRLKLGLGAGWQEREHQAFGFELLNVSQRFDRFEEGLQIITNLFQKKDHFSFEGNYYNLKDVILLPNPEREGGPEILIGGNGEKLTFPLVATYAQEWNAIFLTPKQVEKKNLFMDQTLIKSGKEPKSVRRSLMTNLTYAQNSERLKAKLKGRDPEEMQASDFVVGLKDDVIDQLNQYQQIHLDEIMLQWLDLNDLEGLVHFTENVLPEFL